MSLVLTRASDAATHASWAPEPTVLAGALVVGALYARGWWIMRRRTPERFSGWRLVAFLGGLATIVAATSTPFHHYGELLLQVHMTQHVILTMISAPLLLLGSPAAPLLQGLPRILVRKVVTPVVTWPPLRRLGRALVHPAVAWTSFVVVMWAWHAPALFQLALVSGFWHDVEHAMFLGSALLFWWPVVQPWPSHAFWPRWTMIPYLLAADLQNTALSALFTFSERVIYPAYEAVPRLGGISALEDQATAGAIMWVAGSTVFLPPVIWIVRQVIAERRGVTFRRQTVRAS